MGTESRIPGTNEIINPNTVVFANQVEINSEDDFTIITIDTVDYNQLDDNTVYLLRTDITFTRGFAASGIYTGNIDVRGTLSQLQTFTDVDPIIHGNATNQFGILLFRDFVITGTSISSFFNSSDSTPTEIFAFNGNNIIFLSIGMGVSLGTIVQKNTNMTQTKTPWEMQVAGFDFIYVNAISVVGEAGVGIGDSMIKINGTTAGFIGVTTINAIPSTGDTMFDFTGISTPGINLRGVTHIDALGSGGIYASGTPDFSDPLVLVSSATGTDNPDSNTKSDISFTGNALETTISTMSVAVKVNAVWTENETERFTTDSTGTITYTGIEDKTISVGAVAFQRPVSGSSTDLAVYVALNGTIISSSKGRHEPTSTKGSQCTIMTLVDVVTDDFLEIFVANDDGTVNIVVEDCKVVIIK